jgi:hypothetical protein
MVGALRYYESESDALTQTNMIGSTSYTIGTYGGYTSWRLASNSTGSSSQVPVYHTGDTLNSDGNPSYFLYPASPCFLEGTTVLCLIDGVEKYVPIEMLRCGMPVKTSLNGYKKVELIGKGPIDNPGNDERIEGRLYRCSQEKYPELSEDLYITGCHSVLVDTLTDAERVDTAERLGKIFVTDKKYRLMACVDSRAVPWNSAGTYTIWHLALENDDKSMNYGIYVNGGLLVETCSLKVMKTRSILEAV